MAKHFSSLALAVGRKFWHLSARGLMLSLKDKGGGLEQGLNVAGGGDAIVQRVSDLVQGHEAHVNEALEDWRGTISKFTAMMEGHAGIVHSLEASSSQYESRCAAPFPPETHWLSASMIQWQNLERGACIKRTLSQKCASAAPKPEPYSCQRRRCLPKSAFDFHHDCKPVQLRLSDLPLQAEVLGEGEYLHRGGHRGRHAASHWGPAEDPG